jgi:predicted ATP-dependent serine protease
MCESVDDFHVQREDLEKDVGKRLSQHRVVTIGGLPGCGKSGVLKRFAQNASSVGPILFLKNERLTGTRRSTFASSLGLSNTDATRTDQHLPVTKAGLALYCRKTQ